MEDMKGKDKQPVEKKVLPIREDNSDIHALMYDNDELAEDVYQAKGVTDDNIESEDRHFYFTVLQASE